MKIAVLALDTPYPAHRGGRADIWRRIQGFKALGHSVMLIHHFEPDEEDAQAFKHIDTVVDARVSMPMRRSKWRTLRQLLQLYRRPWHVATRIPSAEDQTELVRTLESFDPDLYWLDGPWVGEIMRGLPPSLRRPYAYRSHNIEHLYIRSQARSARARRDQIAWTLASLNVLPYELGLMRGAVRVLDISMDDLAFWQSHGLSNAGWLPPLADLFDAPSTSTAIAGDVVFTGNLQTPNNLQGLRWLLETVWPRVLAQCPDAHLHVLGSTPTAQTRAWLESHANVLPAYDLPDVRPYLAGARVLVNPIFTGSGVQLKMLDMLMAPAPVVTRTQGMRGLPPFMKDAAFVFDDAEQFAAAIQKARTMGPDQTDARRRAREAFGVAVLDQALKSVKTSRT